MRDVSQQSGSLAVFGKGQSAQILAGYGPPAPRVLPNAKFLGMHDAQFSKSWLVARSCLSRAEESCCGCTPTSAQSLLLDPALLSSPCKPSSLFPYTCCWLSMRMQSAAFTVLAPGCQC